MHVRVQRHTHISVGLEYWYEGHELRALKAVLVEVVRSSVARCYDDNSIIEELGEQSLQHHCVSYVCYLREERNW